MAKVLEEAAPKAEVNKPTLEKEVAEPTPPKVEPTVKAYNQKELDDAVGKGTASSNRLRSLAETRANKAETQIAQLMAVQEVSLAERQEGDARYAELVQGLEDPAEKEKLLSRISIAREKQILARERAEAKQERLETVQAAKSVGLGRKANEMNKEYGIDVIELEVCKTEEEMEVKALKFQLEKPAETQPDEIPDSSISSASGESEWTEAKIKEMRNTPEGIKEFLKHEKEIMKAYREGKVK